MELSIKIYLLVGQLPESLMYDSDRKAKRLQETRVTALTGLVEALMSVREDHSEDGIAGRFAGCPFLLSEKFIVFERFLNWCQRSRSLFWC